ncbi:MAG TPA: LLM class flavin-dependent oxidoreductase [Acidimicrobiales bacterium]|jgi:pyrimidine oxygenase|nr:LLM class flavin-dependent oxidoreductase [Acidimicrobiales bacterium]
MDLGVFLPITNNGWIISHASPQYAPTFHLNRDITQHAEQLGFEFAFSMVKWRGFGGTFGFWDQALESLTLMAGLAPVTSRIRLIGSTQPLALHPAIAARMGATIDDISGGRFGLNLVGGSYRGEYAQMGLWPGDSYYHERYDHLEEWTAIVKDLWEHGVSNHAGRYYTLDDCRLEPRPVQRPHPPLISAGLSDRGLEFATRHADASFVVGLDLDETQTVAARVRELAEAAGRSVRCYAVFTVIAAATDQEAEDRLRHFDDNADAETLAKIGRSREPAESAGTIRAVRQMVARGSSVFTPTLVGCAATLADRITWLDRETALDGIMLTFPDWYRDLRSFGEDVVPRLRACGVLRA